VKWDDDLQTTLVAYGVVAVPTLLAILVFRWRRGGPLLSIPRLKMGRWTGVAVAGYFILFNLTIYAADRALDYAGVYRRIVTDDSTLPPVKDDNGEEAVSAERLQDLRRQNLAVPFGWLAFLAVSFVLLPLVNETRISQAGMTLSRWQANVALGGIAFLVTTPVIYLILFACRPLTPIEPHALELLGRYARMSLVEWGAMFASAVLVVPMAEEWYFRGLVQGWLRRATFSGHCLFIVMMVVCVGSLIVLMKLANHPAPIPFIAYVAFLAIGYGVGVYRLYRPVLREGVGYFAEGSDASARPATSTVESDSDPSNPDLFAAERDGVAHHSSGFGPRWPRWKHAAARWAIVGSAMFFAILHGAWPHPIPLFALGLVLGWLAYRTQSLLPSIVTHALFNLVSFVTLVLIAHASGNTPTEAVRATPSIENVKTVPGSWWPR
jgi:membrane protease YdiL (CAAX protease family)